MDGFGKKIALGAAVAACLAGATGCMHRTSGTEVVGVMVAGPDGQEEMSRAVIVNNAKLGRQIQVVDVRHEYAGDILKASLTLTSKYAGTLKFQYKFAWFNDAGVEVRQDTDAWTPVVLYGNETRTVQGLAPSPDVKAFKVNIRN
jgi:uncharacterized protein YcfL